MDFKFFETLSQEEANLFLANFLAVERNLVDKVSADAKADGVDVTISIFTVKPLFIWILGKIKSVPKAPDADLPIWITKTESYKRGLFGFDQPSKILILRAAYFLGASFIKEYPHLAWGTGDRLTALQNMPVVKGFRKSLEMPPLLVAENIIDRIHSRNAPLQIIDTMVETWIGKVAANP